LFQNNFKNAALYLTQGCWSSRIFFASASSYE